MVKTIVIVGAGFSGTALAVNLLRSGHAKTPRVILINRSGRMARGVAYGTNDSRHLLNVPAGNMSLLPDQPDGFVEYCRRVDPSITPKSFVSREIYGNYLEQSLTDVECRNSSGSGLTRVVGEVVRIESMVMADSQQTAAIHLRDGNTLHADHVVLACGNFAPASPPLEDSSFYSSKRYIRDPWQSGALATIPTHEKVLLIGTGLTAVDVALRFAGENPSRLCYAVSRRGLMPQAHRSMDKAPVQFDASPLVREMGVHVRGYVRALRQQIALHARDGLDWRDIVAALRPHTSALWTRLSEAERRRFLRHVQPHWDVHRHRTAPESHQNFKTLVTNGTLRTLAGNLLRIREEGNSIRVAIRLRGTTNETSVEVGYVVNCTGPNSDVRRVDDPLIRQLITDGVMSADPNGSGVEVTEDYQLVSSQGQCNDVIRYVGPLLRARYWEATAVPELRQHVQQLANILSIARTGVRVTAA
ncbi:FAD/NAD(P)-binding protein [Pararobbsia alpina]|nr:FAD/NAD(P)-binding protein [Pararobbsia alpina]